MSQAPHAAAATATPRAPVSTPAGKLAAIRGSAWCTNPRRCTWRPGCPANSARGSCSSGTTWPASALAGTNCAGSSTSSPTRSGSAATAWSPARARSRTGPCSPRWPACAMISSRTWSATARPPPARATCGCTGGSGWTSGSPESLTGPRWTPASRRRPRNCAPVAGTRTWSPRGGATPLGALGYLRASIELAGQLSGLGEQPVCGVDRDRLVRHAGGPGGRRGPDRRAACRGRRDGEQAGGGGRGPGAGAGRRGGVAARGRRRGNTAGGA